MISPCAGRVVFARELSELRVTADHRLRWRVHVVLSGFDRLDVKLGQSLVAGEPVGVMPTGNRIDAHRPSLYVELRHDGTPVNPAPWLRSSS